MSQITQRNHCQYLEYWNEEKQMIYSSQWIELNQIIICSIINGEWMLVYNWKVKWIFGDQFQLEFLFHSDFVTHNGKLRPIHPLFSIVLHLSIINGPIWTQLSFPLPITNPSIAFDKSAINLSWIFSWIKNRFVATHGWPQLRSFDVIAPATAFFKLADSNTINGALPPNSSPIRFIPSAQCRYNILPTSVEPVNETPAIFSFHQKKNIISVIFHKSAEPFSSFVVYNYNNKLSNF